MSEASNQAAAVAAQRDFDIFMEKNMPSIPAEITKGKWYYQPLNGVIYCKDGDNIYAIATIDIAHNGFLPAKEANANGRAIADIPQREARIRELEADLKQHA